METEVDIQEVLKNMREWAGALVQENAILKAQVNKLNTNDTTE
jgi:cell division protein FtsB